MGLSANGRFKQPLARSDHSPKGYFSLLFFAAFFLLKNYYSQLIHNSCSTQRRFLFCSLPLPFPIVPLPAIEYTISSSNDTVVYAFAYNEERFDTSITATSNGVVDEDFSERIEYLERDEMGNWTKRRRFSLLSDEPVYEFRKLIYR